MKFCLHISLRSIGPNGNLCSVFINGLQVALQVVFSCAFHGICAIIISMNEEGNGATFSVRAYTITLTATYMFVQQMAPGGLVRVAVFLIRTLLMFYPKAAVLAASVLPSAV